MGFRRILDPRNFQGKKQRPVKENMSNVGWLFILEASQSNNQLSNPVHPMSFVGWKSGEETIITCDVG